jgi:hypothetical protein
MVFKKLMNEKPLSSSESRKTRETVMKKNVGDTSNIPFKLSSFSPSLSPAPIVEVN